MTGTFLVSQKAVVEMKKRGGGRIVNLSSKAGKNVSTIGGCHYTAAKTGIIGITRSFAKEFAQDNILANCVCPGLIETQMVTDTIPKVHESSKVKEISIANLFASSIDAVLKNESISKHFLR